MMARVLRGLPCYDGAFEPARGENLALRGIVTGDSENRGAGKGVTTITGLSTSDGCAVDIRQDEVTSPVVKATNCLN
jgi:hypothetical protein